MKLNTWYSAEVLDDNCDEDTTCCELVAFFERSLVLHTTCLTLFKLIFANEVKHVKLSKVLDDNCDEDTTCCELVAFFERSLVLHTTCLTLFKLIFLNEVKHLSIQQRFWTTIATRTRPVVN